MRHAAVRIANRGMLMQIAIIGAGKVGNALAVGWIRAGHNVTFGIRNPQTPPSGGPLGASYADVATASQGAEAVVLSVPWPAVPDALAAAGDLNGKVVIDCTNPLRMGPSGLELEIGHVTSGGERVAALAPGAAVFKTLNQTGFDNMQHAGAFAPLPAAMYVAGDDAARKPTGAGAGIRPRLRGDRRRAAGRGASARAHGNAVDPHGDEPRRARRRRRSR